MVKSECRMSKSERMTNDEARMSERATDPGGLCHSGFGFLSSFDICHSSLIWDFVVRHSSLACAVHTADFDYCLPPELIAQAPAPQRDHSRLLVLQRADGQILHRRFRDLLEYLGAGDVLVLNDSRVIRARLRSTKAGSGGQIEVLLVEENGVNDWWTMLRPGKRVRAGTEMHFHDRHGQPTPLRAVVVNKNEEGLCRLQFSGARNVLEILDQAGEVPLPPYITRETPACAPDDRERYQTVYARTAGSVAAPTAGLHFTEGLLAELRSRGVEVCFVTLHVGLGTFAPVKSETLERHVMHAEQFEVSAVTAKAVNEARQTRRRVVAVGTTTVRVLESVAEENQGRVIPGPGRTRIFIYPPRDFKMVDALLTNFHLPQSTLLMLASAFAAPGRTRGRDLMLSAYAEAIRERYRFYSYGDAMLIL
jgi:S-adenosylmethionine:tRNA ribosyltransferase-isomerase